ncbi:MAG TPA: CYTH domain-containing protein [Patescibacteria group bacterium]|nr:CYTH domain-containing protein [Patescibacteria group bacterium]
MYEIEKNFDLRSGDKDRLLIGATLIGKKSFTDTYYDYGDLRLTRRDYWLRTRNGKFELKVPINKDSIHDRLTDQYKEIENEEEVAKCLNIKIETNLAVALVKADVRPFATVTTKRESYKKNSFRLDFDDMDFGFTTLEVELMVNSPAEISQAETRIIEFAKENGISATLGHGKVIEYLFRYRPEHYQDLIDSGVVKKQKLSY